MRPNDRNRRNAPNGPKGPQNPVIIQRCKRNCWRAISAWSKASVAAACNPKPSGGGGITGIATPGGKRPGTISACPIAGANKETPKVISRKYPTFRNHIIQPPQYTQLSRIPRFLTIRSDACAAGALGPRSNIRKARGIPIPL